MATRLPHLLCALAASLASPACRSAESQRAPAPSSPPPPASAAGPAPSAPASAAPLPRSAFDASFEAWLEKLPAPATLSEGNGASMSCPRHEHATYTLLAATAKKVPLASDADLVGLVRWLRHDDACIRQIALDALLPKVGLEAGQFAVPPMHDPEHYQYHRILVALRAHLDEKRVAYPPATFEGLMLDVTDQDFTATLQGSWEEEIGKSHNFQVLVRLDGNKLEVTRRRTSPDPAWPDHTTSSEIDKATVNAQKQFVLTAAWRMQSTVGRPPGTKVAPSGVTDTFWPVSRDVVWFDEGSHGRWVKLRRKR